MEFYMNTKFSSGVFHHSNFNFYRLLLQNPSLLQKLSWYNTYSQTAHTEPYIPVYLYTACRLHIDIRRWYTQNMKNIRVTNVQFTAQYLIVPLEKPDFEVHKISKIRWQLYLAKWKNTGTCILFGKTHQQWDLIFTFHVVLRNFSVWKKYSKKRPIVYARMICTTYWK